jgi:hypothetical protein
LWKFETHQDRKITKFLHTKSDVPYCSINPPHTGLCPPTTVLSWADPETLLTGGLSYGAIFSIIDGTNCCPKAFLACRSVNLVFISFSVQTSLFVWRNKSQLCMWTYTCAEREILYNTHQEMAIWKSIVILIYRELLALGRKIDIFKLIYRYLLAFGS